MFNLKDEFVERVSSISKVINYHGGYYNGGARFLTMDLCKFRIYETSQWCINDPLRNQTYSSMCQAGYFTVAATTHIMPPSPHSFLLRSSLSREIIY